jgi:hypothetical protein
VRGLNKFDPKSCSLLARARRPGHQHALHRQHFKMPPPKYGPKFDPIMVAVEEAPGIGSIFAPDGSWVTDVASATATGTLSGCRSLSTALTG